MTEETIAVSPEGLIKWSESGSWAYEQATAPGPIAAAINAMAPFGVFSSVVPAAWLSVNFGEDGRLAEDWRLMIAQTAGLA